MDGTADAKRARAVRLAGVAALAAACLALLPTPSATALNNGLARTPPMGWNSWYAFHCGVTERGVLDNARALVSSGMAALGYRYVNVDACWQARRRDRHGRLQANSRTFPHGMAALGRQLHAMGLRFGLYTSAGLHGCGINIPGSYGHYQQDLRTFAAWRVDYLKVDWCSWLPKGSRPQTVYREIARAAARSGRRMITTVSTPGVERPWRWAARDGNSWRIAPDLTGSWASVLRVLDADAPLWRWAHPGGWNDADILQAGNHRLTDDEARAQLSLWSVLASPLLAGNNLPRMAATTTAILANREVLAVDQDRAGRQGRRVSSRGGREVWVRPLADGSSAVVVLNRAGRPAAASVDLRRLWGVRRASAYRVRDLWAETSDVSGGVISRAAVPRHGVVMLRVWPG